MRFTSMDDRLMMDRSFGPIQFGIYCVLISVHDEIVNAVFDIGRGVFSVEELLVVRIVFSKKNWRRGRRIEPPLAQKIVRGLDDSGASHIRGFAQSWAR